MPHDVIDMLSEAGAAYPDRIALRQGRSTYSYHELTVNVTAVATNLQARGVEQGDRFVFSVRMDPDGALLALGIMAAGGTVVINEPTVDPDLFNERVTLTAPKYAVAESTIYAANSPLMRSTMRKRGVETPGVNYGRLAIQHFYTGSWLPGTPLRAVNVNKLLDEPRTTLEQTDPTGDAIIAFHEEATDRKQVLVHSRASLGSATHAYTELCGITSESVLHTDHFVFGLAALMNGSEWSIPESKESGIPVEATHACMSPAQLEHFLDTVDGDSHRSPETLVMHASTDPHAVQRAVELLRDTKVMVVSGLTEVLPEVVTDDAGRIAYVNGDLAGGVILGATARIDNIGGGEAHELVLSGDGLMLGYRNDEGNGKHRSIQDLESANGRKKDTLIRGGKSIYPAIYEPGIQQLSGVSACSLVGVPDGHGEDIVVLVVVPAEKGQNERRLRRKVEAHLNYVMDADALPDVVIVQESLPLSGRSGKPSRIQLRKDVSSTPEVVTVLKERARK